MNISEYFNSEEIKTGAAVALGITSTEFLANMLKAQLKLTEQGGILTSVLLKALIGTLLYNFGKDNTFLKNMALGSMASIFLDIIQMVMPKAQSLLTPTPVGGTIVIPASAEEKKI